LKGLFLVVVVWCFFWIFSGVVGGGVGSCWCGFVLLFDWFF